jgi:hypothetical protein
MTRLISLDLFAGCGGASWGYYLATGRHPDVAVNHNPLVSQATPSGRWAGRGKGIKVKKEKKR